MIRTNGSTDITTIPKYTKTGLIIHSPGATPVVATTASEILDWKRFSIKSLPQKKLKLFMIKFYRGACECTLQNVVSIPLYEVPYKDRPRWFLILALNTTVANKVVSYNVEFDDEQRSQIPLTAFVRNPSVKNTEHFMLEIAHPCLAYEAQLEIYSLAKDMAPGRVPSLYLPLKISTTFDFDKLVRAQQEFRAWWNKESLIAKTMCPSGLDLIIVQRHIAAMPAFRSALGFLTRYGTKKGKPPRKYAGTMQMSDLIDIIRQTDTDEGKKLMESDDQGSLAWILRRMLGISASRISPFAGRGHFDPKQHVDLSIQEDSVMHQIVDSVANLLQHTKRFTGTKKTRWGSTREDLLSQNTMLRLRMREAIINGFLQPIVIENAGSEFRRYQSFLSVSTDGNLYWGTNREFESAFEFKNPTHTYSYVQPEYYDQMQLICGLKGLLFIDFCIGEPHHSTLIRVDFNPEYFNRILFPRAWHAMLYCYLPTLLYAQNFKSFPSWTPHPELREDDNEDPAHVYRYHISKINEMEKTKSFFLPPPNGTQDQVLPDSNYKWRKLPEGFEHISLLEKEQWASEWVDDQLHSGLYPFVPFQCPVQIQQKSPPVLGKRTFSDLSMTMEVDDDDGGTGACAMTKEEEAFLLRKQSEGYHFVNPCKKQLLGQ